MKQSYEEYSMPLKNLITSVKWDPDVLNDPKRDNSRVGRTMGIQWDVVSDTVLALPKYNLHGTSRGRPLGPDLI